MQINKIVATVLVISFGFTGVAFAKSNNSPMALCKDGTYSYSNTHRGTCSHHKGVKIWYR